MGRMAKPEPAERGHAGLCSSLHLILRTMGHHRRGLSAPDKTKFMFLKGHSSFLCRIDYTEARKTGIGPCKRMGSGLQQGSGHGETEGTGLWMNLDVVFCSSHFHCIRPTTYYKKVIVRALLTAPTEINKFLLTVSHLSP